jgi:hypothetical protein
MFKLIALPEFGTNTIGHFFLTELLVCMFPISFGAWISESTLQLPALTASYDESKTPACVINTSSDLHNQLSSGIEFASLKAGPERDAWVKKAGSFMGPMCVHASLSRS